MKIVKNLHLPGGLLFGLGIGQLFDSTPFLSHSLATIFLITGLMLTGFSLHKIFQKTHKINLLKEN